MTSVFSLFKKVCIINQSDTSRTRTRHIKWNNAKTMRGKELGQGKTQIEEV